MATMITATLPTTFAQEGQGTTTLAVDTITEFTASTGVTISKALTLAAGSTVTTGGQTITAGDLTVTAGKVVMAAAASRLVPGATSFSVRNNANSGDNLLVADSGNTTVGGTLTVNGAGTITGASTLTGNVAAGGTLSVVGATTPTGGVAAAGGFSVSPRLFHSGGAPVMISTDGNDSTPVATEVYIAEVFVDANCTLTGVGNFNGSVASGNIKVGLADSTGAIVATSASTAMSGTDAYQRVPFTATYAAKGPATYFILLFVDNNTARYNTWPLGNFGAAKQTGQVYATGFTAITPPTTFTANLGAIASLY